MLVLVNYLLSQNSSRRQSTCAVHLVNEEGDGGVDGDGDQSEHLESVPPPDLV